MGPEVAGCHERPPDHLAPVHAYSRRRLRELHLEEVRVVVVPFEPDDEEPDLVERTGRDVDARLLRWGLLIRQLEDVRRSREAPTCAISEPYAAAHRRLR